LCVVGLLSGVVCFLISATPFGKSLEENFGLAFLFKVRGGRAVPQEAVICAIERKSAEFFGLKQQPYKWPRTLHAATVDRLTALGVTGVGLDLFFEESRSAENDRALAGAMQRSGKVVLLQRLKNLTDFSDGNRHNPEVPPDNIRLEQLIQPIPLLEQQAFALAPFPLPRRPVRLDQAWLFKGGAGGRATLPVVLFAMSVPGLFDRFIELAGLADPSVLARDGPFAGFSSESQRFDLVIQQAKTIFSVNGKLAAEMKKILDQGGWKGARDQVDQRMLHTMIDLFAGGNSTFINYYGPPGTIHSFPYYTLFQQKEDTGIPALQGKVVLIGLTDEAEMGEKDGFYTIYTDPDGNHISGVEVAATLFANLVDGSSIKPLGALFGSILFLILGIGIGVVSHLLPSLMAVLVSCFFCLAYAAISYALFVHFYLWNPLVVPLMLQAPLTCLAVIFLRQRDIQQNKRNIEKALQCYIPKSIVAQLEQDFSLIASRRDVVHGICLFSDIENFTPLSENAAHGELSQLINRYYEEMFHIVKQHEGMILDIRGDSMLALWLIKDSEIIQVDNACRAATVISHIYNNPEPASRHHLPTRIGLHRGRISLGNIGALDHYQYTITGDTVNTAARIESFNKQLGTRLLVSEKIAQNSVMSQFRKMGTFLFAGKSKPLTIYELLGEEGSLSDKEKELSHYFAMALEKFQEGRWAESREIFESCISVNPDYGPATWFRQLCSRYITSSADYHWNGVISLGKK